MAWLLRGTLLPCERHDEGNGAKFSSHYSSSSKVMLRYGREKEVLEPTRTDFSVRRPKENVHVSRLV